MNEHAQTVLGTESYGALCERAMRGTTATGEPICRAGCVAALATREQSYRFEPDVRVRRRTLSLLCQPVGNEVVVVARPTDSPEPGECLTAREKQVLSCVARGLSSNAIAAELGIKNATVRTHVEHALGRLGARTRAEAVLRAIHTGQLSRPEDESR